jgi:hypothetical protein
MRMEQSLTFFVSNTEHDQLFLPEDRITEEFRNII